MAQDHQLNESEQQKLRLFVSRAVFPLIHNDIYPDPDPGFYHRPVQVDLAAGPLADCKRSLRVATLAADDVYVVQAKIFAALPPSALHIPPEVPLSPLKVGAPR
jgi:hypothetical protein